MKKEWMEKYRRAPENIGNSSKALIAFNSSIDIYSRFKDLSIQLEDIEKSNISNIKSEKDFKKTLKYFMDRKENIKVDLKKFKPKIEGERKIGGEAAIISNFLSRIGERAILYTPFLSEELTQKIDQEIVYPVLDNGLKLKSIEEAVNSDRTKKNYIIKLNEGSKQLILSDSLRGFGPFFRKGLEEKFEYIEKKVDYAIFSGFHNVEGNIESKLKKAEKQMAKLEVPKHLEMAECSEELRQLLTENVLPKFDSLGVNEHELRKVAKETNYNLEENPSLGHIYAASKKIIEEYNIQRVHAHTKRLQIVTAKKEYSCSEEQMRNGLLLGGLAAASMADKRKIPGREDLEVDIDSMHVKVLDEFEDFKEFFSLKDFVETGTAEVEEYKLAAVPALLHEEPERIRGIGEVISAAAFSVEH